MCAVVVLVFLLVVGGGGSVGIGLHREHSWADLLYEYVSVCACVFFVCVFFISFLVLVIFILERKSYLSWLARVTKHDHTFGRFHPMMAMVMTMALVCRRSTLWALGNGNGVVLVLATADVKVTYVPLQQNLWLEIHFNY